MASAADVPGKYDVVINGQGYTFFRPLDGSYLTSGRHHAEYGYTPTFLERTNVGAAYGDSQQDFWLTISQKDWSLGEEQRYLHATDPDQLRKFYTGTAVDVSLPGRVAMLDDSETLTAAAAVVGMAGDPYSGLIYIATSSTAYSINSAGTITSLGAHGVTASSTIGIAPDGPGSGNVFFCSSSTGVRQRSSGGVWSLFNGTVGPDVVLFANNTLYSTDGERLWSYDTAGTPTTLFTFKSANGTPISDSVQHKLLYYGGKILYTRRNGLNSSGGELWVYDGTAFSLLAAAPPNFELIDSCVVMGVVILAGRLNSTRGKRPAIFYYVNGTINLLWQAEDYGNFTWGASNVAAFRSGFLFTDETKGTIRYFDLPTGAISSVCAYTPTAGGSLAASGNHATWNGFTNSTITHWPKASTVATASTVSTSLIDFDSSLTKNFRAVIIDFDAATDGNGGSVDVSYSVGATTSYTSLATGVTSGTEVTFSGVSGHSISLKVTLNKGTSTAGPVLKRIYVRAAPVLQAFKLRTYNLDLTSTQSLPTQLQDTTNQPLTGHEQATNLISAITSTSPITITDRFGTYTGILEPDQCRILELHSDGDTTPATSGQFVATLFAREV